MIGWVGAAWLLLAGSTVLLFLGLPVAFSFLAINLLGAWLWLGGEPGLAQLARNSVSSVMSFSLTPIPLFVLMGEVLFHTGLAVKVIDGIERLIAQVPGRLAVVAVVAGTVFSAISGSTIATTAMLGSLMVPVMLARGYHPTLATGPVMAIGAVDMLIPPSALTVLLGSLSGISISKLLIGGVVPGLVLSLAFVAWIVVRVRMKPSLAPNAPLVRASRASRASSRSCSTCCRWSRSSPSSSARWPRAGARRPSRPRSARSRRSSSRWPTARSAWKILLASLKGTVAISAMILFIIVGATTFAQILSFSGASNGLSQAITGAGLAPWAVIAAMMLMLIFLGIFVDQVSMMMITLPIFMPVVQALGVDLVWFGVLFLICMQMGLLLPPHGLLLMTMKGVAPPSVTMLDIFRAVVPFLVMSVLLLALVFLVPAVATWLPALIG